MTAAVNQEPLAIAQSFSTLDQALKWALSLQPPASIATVVTQDEFTHDVVLQLEHASFLVFDTN
jgi:hypothetical protein